MNGKIRLGLIWINAFIYRQTTLASNCEGLEVEICNTIKNHSRRCDKTFCKFLQLSRLTLKALQHVLFYHKCLVLSHLFFKHKILHLMRKSNSINDKFRFTFEVFIYAPLLRIKLHYVDFFTFYLCKKYSYYIMRSIFF